MEKTYYVASWFQDEGKEGLYRLRYDADMKKLASKQIITGVTRTSYFARENDILYVLSEMPMAIPDSGYITSYMIEDDNLVQVCRSELFDSGVTHLCVSHDKKHLYASGYGTGTLLIFDIDENGMIFNQRKAFTNVGSGPNKERQTSSHLHFTSPTPDGDYLLTCDLGADEILISKVVDNGDVERCSTVKVTPGYGPRHLCFSKDNRYVYVICELVYHILVYAYSDGKLELENDIKLEPEMPKCSGIKLSNDGKTLFTGHRENDSECIEAFDISNPTEIRKIDAFEGTIHCRDFSVFADDYLAAVNQFGDSIQFLKFEDNKLKDAGRIEDIKIPVAIIEI